MASISAPLSPTTLDDLRQLYAVKEAETDILDVDRFLHRHGQIVPLLFEARPAIARHFGPDTPVRLEVVVDPESDAEDGDAELFAMIQTRFQPEEAMPRLVRFRDEWWLANLRRANCRLEFGLWYPRSSDAV